MIRENILKISIILICIVSCDSATQNDIEQIDIFLKENFAFNVNKLNEYHVTYQRLKAEQPNKFSSIELDTLISNYHSTIKKAELSLNENIFEIKSTDSLIRVLIEDSNKFVENSSEYSIASIEGMEISQFDSKKTALLLLMNNLTISIKNALEYHLLKDNIYVSEMLYAKVNSNHRKTKNGQILINLSGEFLYPEKKRMQKIIVEQIYLHKNEINLDFKIQDNYNFGTIVLDNIEKGDVYLKGKIVRYFKHEIIEIPFDSKFSLD